MVLFYQGQQGMWQRHMQSVVKNEQERLQKLTLSLSDYNKSRVGIKEILLHGKMYDVERVRIAGDTVELYAIEDSEEVKIVSKMHKAMHGKPDHNNVPQPLIELLTLNYILPEVYQISRIPDLEQELFKRFNAPVISRQQDIFIPPPQLS